MQSTAGPPARRSRRHRVRALTIALAAVVLTMSGVLGALVLRDRAETARTTTRYDPPVWAGQNVPGACSGGFYARDGDAIAITIVGHCALPGTTLKAADGSAIGVFGPLASISDCPVGRLCFASDFLPLDLTEAWIPWGHLNLVDLGVGGYRTIEAGTRPLGCGDIHVGDRVEVDGREHYRTGSVLEIGPYAHETDVMFPCMVVTDIDVFVGDSGGAVLVNGLPAGVISRSIGGHLGFTPLAEGLDNLGLELCTTPACDVMA